MLRLIAAIVAILPWRWLGVPGAVVGWLAGSVLRVRRAAVDAAMRRAGVARCAAPAMYAGLGRGLFELLWLAGARAARRERAVGEAVTLDEAATRTLDEALRRGPVVLAASHTGNWELVAFAAARWLARRAGSGSSDSVSADSVSAGSVSAGSGARRLAVVAKPLSVRAVHAFSTRLRQAAGLRVVSPDGALGAARRALSAGDVLAMPIDQVPEAPRHALRAPFLGADAHCDRAPATVAYRAGATLVVVAASRTARGDRHVVRVLAALDPTGPHGLRGQAWIAEATRSATLALETFVRQEPAAWLWLHRRWREPEAPRRGPLRLVASAHPG